MRVCFVLLVCTCIYIKSKLIRRFELFIIDILFLNCKNNCIDDSDFVFLDFIIKLPDVI